MNATVKATPKAKTAKTAKTAKMPQIRLSRSSPEYWRVTFDNPPLNLMGPEFVVEFAEIMTAIETDEQVKVVVFDSAVEGFFLNHSDFTVKMEELTSLPQGPTGLEAWPDILVRIARAPVVSIAKIRGRATENGSELSLASDMSFASREKAILSQWEVGVGLVAGGGPMTRLPRLIGRNRAMEVLLGSEDMRGDLAQDYGYVNRSLPDTELDRFVDALATRWRRASLRSTSGRSPTQSVWLTPLAYRRTWKWPPGGTPAWPRLRGPQPRPGSKPSSNWGFISPEMWKIVWDTTWRNSTVPFNTTELPIRRADRKSRCSSAIY
jgi:enoyl-CoA hydratase/carnithine racemase